LPAAACIVNPNQLGCSFPSKHLAGVGVMFYVLVALRAELRRRDWFKGRKEPNLAELLDLVALGTVADVVRLDDNNRILVHHGLQRIRAGRAHAGVEALISVAGRDAARVSTYDLGFVLGPRLNAAGRLETATAALDLLLARDFSAAMEMARKLDSHNRERQKIEKSIVLEASEIKLSAEDQFKLKALAEIVMGNAAIVPGDGVLRIEIDGAVEIGQGPLCFALAPEDLAAVGKRERIGWIGLQHRRAAGEAPVVADLVGAETPLPRLRG